VVSEKRRGLGRGLGALIPSAGEAQGPARERPVDVFFPNVVDHGVGGSAVAVALREDGEPEDVADELLPVPGAVFAELPISSIRPNARQPRTVFDEEALDELVGSIREVGVLQPVVVRAVDDGYELVMGERRWRATQAAGLTSIPAIIRETADSDLLRDALLENLHRVQLNPLEEAAAYQQMLEDFGCTQEELATRIHRSRPQISNTLRLLKLPPLVQRRVAAGVLSAGHARALLALPDAGAMERLAQRIVAEGLSVRAVEEIVTLGGVDEDRKSVV
jgi:ParB family chromosome partitioning protein